MPEKYTLNCVKCGAKYDSAEPDPYYCPPCEEQKKEIAKEVDAKMAKIERKQIKSALQIYDESCKARGSQFANIKDLMI